MCVVGVHLIRLQAPIENLVALTPQFGFEIALVHGETLYRKDGLASYSGLSGLSPSEPRQGRNEKGKPARQTLAGLSNYPGLSRCGFTTRPIARLSWWVCGWSVE
jgi:hypothetical protein